MRAVAILCVLSVALGGCASLTSRLGWGSPQTPVVAEAENAAQLPAAPPPAAKTVEEFDTTTPEQRAEATSASLSSDSLGRTVVSLGNPTEPGFWLKTPLVTEQGEGVVFNPATKKSVSVTLIPIDGPRTAGSRMSLPALRLIGAELGALTEVDVRRAD